MLIAGEMASCDSEQREAFSALSHDSTEDFEWSVQEPKVIKSRKGLYLKQTIYCFYPKPDQAG